MHLKEWHKTEWRDLLRFSMEKWNINKAGDFDVLLTVYLSINLAVNQLNAQNIVL